MASIDCDSTVYTAFLSEKYLCIQKKPLLIYLVTTYGPSVTQGMVPFSFAFKLHVRSVICAASPPTPDVPFLAPELANYRQEPVSGNKQMFQIKSSVKKCDC
jgi:hypothetical protein